LASERHDGEELKLGIVKTKQRRSFRNKGAKRERWAVGGWEKRVDFETSML
jgi:hypothetical protein